MTSPADRPQTLRPLQVDHRAAQIRGDLAYRRACDPEVYANLVDHYQRDGYGLDGYPLGYPSELKTLA